MKSISVPQSLYPFQEVEKKKAGEGSANTMRTQFECIRLDRTERMTWMFSLFHTFLIILLGVGEGTEWDFMWPTHRRVQVMLGWRVACGLLGFKGPQLLLLTVWGCPWVGLRWCLKLSLIWPRLSWNSLCSWGRLWTCDFLLYFPNAVILRVCHRAWFAVLRKDPGLPVWD